ncbi:ABC transporter ATP-binding protein [Bordetella bronchialis]|uniref:ABC transporter ATP-binding protein n=1 Tax=Bordetella bronchialis TaxID=463025 RepID=A0A193FQE1_9BORD|nr:ABC transporter ATP-binding protein [Bordetella bronchialis]ANN69299.1 ABC transporter ATP-binding protein [Bordetella bronchialis]ANN74446.1 ABC transporter ATP-binding protein [Bordetella bronchialis]
MAAIVLEQLTKQYADTAAIREVSVVVPAGSFTVLLGPSGCGKSTTLRMIAGLDTPTSGRILIGDRDVTHLPPAQRRIAMVFQSYALFPHLNVRENILFGLKVRKEPRAAYEQRLARVAELLGLQKLLDRKPAQLSGGQQQRVALGRAVISEAPVCLMDEPLSNLDAQLRHDMRREIRALQRQLGMTMVYVTHDQTEAMSMADQIVLLRNGAVEQRDTPDGLYARPATEFAARFIGTPPMNLLLLDTVGGVRVLAGTGEPPVAGAPAGAARLGVRPEHIRLAPQGRPAIVQGVEYFGADSIVTCAVGASAGIAVRLTGHATVAAGDRVCLDWAPERQHFFDAQGGALPPS